MIKKKLISTAGLTLIEILIGVVVSTIMMAAIYTTYTVVNTTYGQVLEKAKVSRSSRDLIELLIRDIRNICGKTLSNARKIGSIY